MASWTAGALAGLVATAAMTLIELAAWSRWGLAGLLDWQINASTLAWVLRRPSECLVPAGFTLHFLHGLIGGAVFALLLPLVSISWPVWILGIGFGAVLFLVTLLVFRPITGRGARSGPIDTLALAVALVTHLAYGAVLGLLIL